MSMFDELKGDALKFGLMFAAILVFVGMFKLYASAGILGFIVIIVVVALGAGGYWMYKNGRLG